MGPQLKVTKWAWKFNEFSCSPYNDKRQKVRGVDGSVLKSNKFVISNTKEVMISQQGHHLSLLNRLLLLLQMSDAVGDDAKCSCVLMRLYMNCMKLVIPLHFIS